MLVYTQLSKKLMKEKERTIIVLYYLLSASYYLAGPMSRPKADRKKVSYNQMS